jgi:Domain of unknown function (DUF4173)
MSDPTSPPAAFRPLAWLAALVALADVLFWGHEAGLSLALFAIAVFATALRDRLRPRALAVLVLAVLPVVELVQPLSVAILTLGLAAALVLQARPGAPLWPAILSLLSQIPRRAPLDLARAAGRLDSPTAGRLLRNWSLPLGGLLVLLSLLSAANPVLDGWLARLTSLPFQPGESLRRALFWAGVALVAWPLILADPGQVAHRQGPPRPGNPQRLGLNPGSVSRALVLFNLGLALQTLLDARYLWSGATPPGLTLAEYAHRGAYPLLATALLAGAFALAARPFVAQRPALRALLYLWLAQNIWLTVSALYRLDLYIRTFGLTYLRVHAAIWMALVALGLAFTAFQIATQRSNRWLLLRSATLGAATLYLCAFVNFADLIARTNLSLGKVDLHYLCQLGPAAAAAIPPSAWGPKGEGHGFVPPDCHLAVPSIESWRDWGFRNWRVLHRLSAQEGAS